MWQGHDNYPIAHYPIAPLEADPEGCSLYSLPLYHLRYSYLLPYSTQYLLYLLPAYSLTARRLEEDSELPGVSHIFVDEVHARSTDIDGVRLYLLRLNLLCHASYSPGARTLNGVRLSADGAARPPLALTLTPTLTLP